MPNKGRDNMGKDEEQQPSRTRWRRIGAKRMSSLLIELNSVNMIAGFSMMIIVSFFQENKSYGIKTICIDPLSTRL
jgi:hypothetical protein